MAEPTGSDLDARRILRGVKGSRSSESIALAQRLIEDDIPLSVVAEMTHLTKQKVRTLATIQGRKLKSGQAIKSLGVIMEKASTHLEASLYGAIFQHFQHTRQDDVHSVSGEALDGSIRSFRRMCSASDVSGAAALLVAGAMSRGEAFLKRCPECQAEFLAAVEQVLVKAEWTRGECPCCKIRRGKSKPNPAWSTEDPVLEAGTQS